MEEFIKNNLEIVTTFRRTLSKETDRGCALMAAAFLENEITKLLRKKLFGTEKHLESIFEFNGPLGTFSSKIKMSYSLGLISPETFQDLELIRRIRNEFGHEYKEVDFRTHAIKSRIDNLKKHFFSKGEAEPRAIFTNTVVGILALIHGETFKAEKFKERKDIPITVEKKETAKAKAVKLTDTVMKKLLKKKEVGFDDITKAMFTSTLSDLKKTLKIKSNKNKPTRPK